MNDTFTLHKQFDGFIREISLKQTLVDSREGENKFVYTITYDMNLPEIQAPVKIEIQVNKKEVIDNIKHILFHMGDRPETFYFLYELLSKVLNSILGKDNNRFNTCIKEEESINIYTDNSYRKSFIFLIYDSDYKDYLKTYIGFSLFNLGEPISEEVLVNASDKLFTGLYKRISLEHDLQSKLEYTKDINKKFEYPSDIKDSLSKYCKQMEDKIRKYAVDAESVSIRISKYDGSDYYLYDKSSRKHLYETYLKDTNNNVYCAFKLFDKKFTDLVKISEDEDGIIYTEPKYNDLLIDAYCSIINSYYSKNMDNILKDISEILDIVANDRTYRERINLFDKKSYASYEQRLLAYIIDHYKYSMSNVVITHGEENGIVYIKHIDLDIQDNGNRIMQLRIQNMITDVTKNLEWARYFLLTLVKLLVPNWHELDYDENKLKNFCYSINQQLKD